MLKPKISIIGAGNVGIRYAYSLMMSGFARSIVIVDVDAKRAQGEVLDLASGLPYVSPVEILAGDYTDIVYSDVVVITAGKKQKPGQTRLELVKDNVEIFRSIIPQIIRYAKEAILVIATNPVDILSYATYRISGKPWQEIIGSGTVLDTARLRLLLSKHCDIDSRNIHAYILGEHGDSELPVWSSAMLGGTFLKDYCPLCNKCNPHDTLNAIFEEVKTFAYRVIERKGETSYGIGLALTRITEAIVKDENSVLPVSCLAQDYYKIHEVYMGLPAVVCRKGVREILKLQLNSEETKQLEFSAQTLKSVIKEVGL
ncbi:MAG: L-lactate dehydrogenase [Candidatus Omnitrophota bacterium]